MIIFDASLAVKWYLAETHSDEARAAFEHHAGNILAPDTILTEVVGAMVRRANMNKTDRSASEASIAKFIGLISEGFIQVAQISPEKMAQAATLALDLGLPFKDCIYLTLAMELDCDLVTCDAKFAAKTKGVWDHVHVLGQFDPRR